MKRSLSTGKRIRRGGDGTAKKEMEEKSRMEMFMGMDGSKILLDNLVEGYDLLCDSEIEEEESEDESSDYY